MAARFVGTSVNIVQNTGNNKNLQNARIHFDTSDALGWTVDSTDGTLNGTLSGGTQLRRAVLDVDDKGTPGASLDMDVGVTYAYIAAQKRTVKALNGNNTAARVVFSPGSL